MKAQNKRILIGHLAATGIVLGWPILFYIVFLVLRLEIISNAGLQALTHAVGAVQAAVAVALAIWTVRSFRDFSRGGRILSCVSVLVQFTVIFVVHRGLIALLKW